MTKLSDEWQTPKWLFDELNKEFNLHVDVCCNEKNCKCLYRHDALIPQWSTRFITGNFSFFMNPPYSNPKPYIEAAWEESKSCKVVCLVKCDPSTKWWGIFWDYKAHKPKPGCEVRFLPKRVKFEAPVDFEGKITSSAFPTAIIIMDRRNTYKGIMLNLGLN